MLTLLERTVTSDFKRGCVGEVGLPYIDSSAEEILQRRGNDPLG